MTDRTTRRLVRTAVDAVEAAGITVGAVEVQRGGVVRVLAIEAVTHLPSEKKGSGKSCDEIFGASG